MIAEEFHKLIQKIPTQKNHDLNSFLPLDDIDALDQRLNDKSFNDSFVSKAFFLILFYIIKNIHF